MNISDNIHRYQGLWYEFARTDLSWERMCDRSTAEYRYDKDNNVMYVTNTCLDSNGNVMYNRTGEAKPIDLKKGKFILEFTDGLPSDGKSDYTIESTDYVSYSIVTSKYRGRLNHAWMLTRKQRPDAKTISIMKHIATSLGINLNTMTVSTNSL